MEQAVQEFEAAEVPETQALTEAPEVAETPEAVDPNRPARRKKK